MIFRTCVYCIYPLLCGIIYFLLFSLIIVKGLFIKAVEAVVNTICLIQFLDLLPLEACLVALMIAEYFFGKWNPIFTNLMFSTPPQITFPIVWANWDSITERFGFIVTGTRKFKKILWWFKMKPMNTLGRKNLPYTTQQPFPVVIMCALSFENCDSYITFDILDFLTTNY